MCPSKRIKPNLPDRWFDEQAPLTVTPLQLPGFDEPH
jgi:hypothetical protein